MPPTDTAGGGRQLLHGLWRILLCGSGAHADGDIDDGGCYNAWPVILEGR